MRWPRFNASLRAKDLAGTIATIRAAGITTVQGIASALNEQGIQGAAWWHVARYSRLTGTRAAALRLGWSGALGTSGFLS